MLTLDDIADHAGRPVAELTRRDVARALLEVPAERALAALPELRRASPGGAFSEAFWSSVEDVLTDIRDGTATVGDVHRFLESTGSEPTAIIGLHVWDDEDARSDLEALMHDRLVHHLEQRVAAGDTDPDALVAGDEDAWDHHIRIQYEWMDTPQPDGTVPMQALLDEADARFERAWEEADAAALAELERVLAEVGDRPRPDLALRAVCDQLRAQLVAGERPYDLLASAGGMDPAGLPADDAELWLALAQGVFEPVDEPPGWLTDDEAAAWFSLAHVDLLGAVTGLARGGPGTPAHPEGLVRLIDTSPDVDGRFEDEDDADLVAFAFETVVGLWRLIGAVDLDDRLTPLGWWGVPEGLRRAWSP